MKNKDLSPVIPFKVFIFLIILLTGKQLCIFSSVSNNFFTVSFYLRARFSFKPTHNVHDSQDVAFHIFAPMVLHHFGVSHHQRFHPLLFANRALSDPPAFPLLAALPAFALPFSALETLMGIWELEIKKYVYIFR